MGRESTKGCGDQTEIDQGGVLCRASVLQLLYYVSILFDWQDRVE